MIDRRTEYQRALSAVVVLDEPSGPRHLYLSTHCLHAVLNNDGTLHERCEATELAPGVPRKPSQCKHCAAACLCWCHD